MGPVAWFSLKNIKQSFSQVAGFDVTISNM